MLGNVDKGSTIGWRLLVAAGLIASAGAQSFALVGSDSKPRGQLPFRETLRPTGRKDSDDDRLEWASTKECDRVGWSQGRGRVVLLEIGFSGGARGVIVQSW